MLKSLFFSIVFPTLISLCLTSYCPKAQDLYPCKCFTPKDGFDVNFFQNYAYIVSHKLFISIFCVNKGVLDLTSIFSKVSQDERAAQQIYEAIFIENDQITEIPENALGKLKFRSIFILENCSKLKKIHSKAFLHQSLHTEQLYILAENVISGQSPYSFYDLVNSFDGLDKLVYVSRIGTLEEKLNENMNNISFIALTVDKIIGSPFSGMTNVQFIHLFYGQLNHISIGTFKFGNIKVKNRKIILDLSGNRLNGSSFEKGVFTDPSLNGIKIHLELSSNQIEYLDRDIFSPFLSSGNSIIDLRNNQLDCDDLRSAWICESTTSEQNRQVLHFDKLYPNDLCVDNRHLTDCEKNFKNRIYSEVNLSPGQNSTAIITISSSRRTPEKISTITESSTSTIKAAIETEISTTETLEGNITSETEQNKKKDYTNFSQTTFITTIFISVCVLLIIIVARCKQLGYLCGFVSSLNLLTCIKCKCFWKKKNDPNVNENMSSGEIEKNHKTIDAINGSNKREKSIIKYLTIMVDNETYGGDDSIRLALLNEQRVIWNNERNQIETDDNNSYEQKNKIRNISRFSLLEQNKSHLGKVLLPRNLLTVLTPEIARGHFGKVFKGVLKLSTGQSEEVAVKTLDQSFMNKSGVNSFIKEGLTMKDFNHDNVLSLIGIMIDNGLPILITPLMDQDLASFIRNEKNQITIELIINFSIQIAQGMAYISSLKYVHRDLAARNCLLALDQVTVKIADFGLSRDVYETSYYSQRSRTGVPWKWMSPESITNLKSNLQTSDVWSYGVVMWELMTRGETPYEGLYIGNIVSYLEAGNRLKCPFDCPIVYYEIMLKCWHSNPELRPTFDELVEQVKDVIIILKRKDIGLLKKELNKKKIVNYSSIAFV